MKFAHTKKIKNAFTLIELLVVVSIIGILVTLVFAGSRGVIDNARKTEAKAMAVGIKNGISNYVSEYRRMPVPSTATASGDSVDVATGDVFMDILLGFDTDRNRKGISYLKAKPAKRAGSGLFVSGLEGNGTGGGILRDPWGNRYGVRMNVVNKDLLENPYVTIPSLSNPTWGGGNGTVTNQLINDDVIVWSSGKDANDADDNVTTFE